MFNDVDIFRGPNYQFPELGPEWQSLRQTIKRNSDYNHGGFDVYQTTRHGYTVQLVLSWHNCKLSYFDIPQHRVMLSLQPLEQLSFTQFWPDDRLDQVRYLGRLGEAYAYSIGFSPYWIKDICEFEFKTTTQYIAKCLNRGYPVASELALWAQAGDWHVYGIRQQEIVYLSFANDQDVLHTTWEDSLFHALTRLNLEEETQ